MKRVFTIILLIICILGLVACATDKGESVDTITPKQWTEYADEIASYLATNITSIDYDKEFLYDFALNHEINLEDSLMSRFNGAMSIKLRGNVMAHGGEGLFEVKDTTANKSKIWMYHDNNDLYVIGSEGKIKYEKVPLNDVILKLLNGDQVSNYHDVIHGSIFRFLTSFFSDGYASKDKSEYNFTFDFDKIVRDKLFDDIWGIMPNVIRDAICTHFDMTGIDDIYSHLAKLSGDIAFKVDDGKISSIDIVNNVDGTEGVIKLNVSSMHVDNGHLNDLSTGDTLDAKFITRKAGDFSYEGTIDLVDSDKSIANYGVYINSHLDMVQLFLNDFDMTSVGDDNYFHFKISQNVRKQNKKFLAERYLEQDGSIIEIGFSPRDFRNNKLYISISPRAILNKEAVDIANVLPEYVIKVLPDYQLFTINTDVQIANMVRLPATLKERVDSITKFMQLVNTNYTKNKHSLTIDHIGIMQLFAIPPNIVSSIIAMMGDGANYADEIQIETSKIEPHDYNIADMTININTKDNNSSELKQYTSLFDEHADPAIAWNYYDKNVDNGINVHNLYNKDKTLTYGIDVPMSKVELSQLIGGYIKYSYVNYKGELKGDSGDCFAKILSVVKVGDTLDNGYSPVTIRVRYPSIWSGLLNDYVFDMVDNFLYDEITVYIKFEDIRSKEVTKYGKDTYYYGENVPNDMLKGKVTLTYDSGIKSYDMVGECSTIGDLYTPGVHKVKFNVLGEIITKEITVLSKDNNLGVDVLLEFNEVHNLFEKKDGVWHVIQTKGKKIGKSIFDKVTVKIRHTDTYESKRSVRQDELFYVYDGTKYSLKDELRGVWWHDTDGGLIFDRVGEYRIESNANGLATQTEYFILDIIEDDTMNSSAYIIEDNTKYKEHYFANSVYYFEFGLVNTYHGERGRVDQMLDINLRRGYNKDGNLSYEKVENINMVATLVSIDVVGIPYVASGKYGAVDIPASIRDNVSIKVGIRFTKVGYYNLNINVGNLYRKSSNIYVEADIAPLG